ncbi:hypothetical protein PsYK624_043030 [Phanerochaete sordida]|uniref:Uncharacterized protein n=1 Tax=Phanerochaete sordida TaxID=48140 RepID=A0A9P3G5I7_9APHY|nr:hypothetical protein PsYK624_043030 [Phanerochaete sordida]
MAGTMNVSASLGELGPLQVARHILQRPGEECFRHLLALAGDYYLDPDGETRLRDGIAFPEPSNWCHFQSDLGLNIGVLKLDLSTVRSLPVWKAIQWSAPALFSFPQLHTLHISMDQVEEQTEFAARFVQPTLHDLSLLVFPLSRLMKDRADTQRTGDPPNARLEEYLDSVAETWYPNETAAKETHPIQQLYSAVESCQRLQRLQFVVADAHAAYATRHLLVNMVKKLTQIRTLIVAPHTAVAPILCLLSDHPALRSFSAFQADFTTAVDKFREDPAAEKIYAAFWDIWNPAADPRTQQAHITLRQPVRDALTALTLEIDPAQFLGVVQHWTRTGVCLPRVERLHLHCTTRDAGIVSDEAEVHALLTLLPVLFPALRSLRVGPLRWNARAARAAGVAGPRRFCVRAPALRALAPLHALEELTFETAYFACVSAAEWAEVLPHWPRLRALRLHSAQRVFVDAPDAPLDAVLALFARCCPEIGELYLTVAAVSVGPAETWVFPRKLRSLVIALNRLVYDPKRTLKALILAVPVRDPPVWPVSIVHYQDQEGIERDEEAALFDA